MDITQDSAAIRQALNEASANSPRPASGNEQANSQQSKTCITAVRAVQGADIPNISVQENETLPKSSKDSMEGMTRRSLDDMRAYEQRIDDYHQAELEMMNASFDMYESRKGFKAEVTAMFPELNTEDFGLSVDAEGELIILNKGNLTEEQHTQLTSLLQSSSHYATLKRYANEVMDASIGWAKAKNGTERQPSLHEGGVDLDINKQNFNQLFDFYSEESITSQIRTNAPQTEHTYKVTTYTNGQWVDSWV